MLHASLLPPPVLGSLLPPPATIAAQVEAQSVAGWLESIGKQRHAAAFTENFETLEELRQTASDEGIPMILEACGVRALGDKTAIRRQ